MLSLGYLGPQGSHSHQTAHSLLDYLFPTYPVELIPAGSLAVLMEQAEAGAVDLALLPYENALEGSVVEVLETLGLNKRTLYTHAELLHPIVHCLIQADATTTPTTILSHPQALSQCRDTLKALYGPDLGTIATTSTSEAVKQVAAKRDEPGLAAIGTAMAAALNGLQVTSRQISDASDNLTRFFLVSGQEAWQTHWPPLTQRTPVLKTSACIGLPEYPGVLMECLGLFKRYEVNLSKLESRPTRRHYGDYYFFMDIEGDVTSLANGELLKELQAFSTFCYIQGPYVGLGHLGLDDPLSFYQQIHAWFANPKRHQDVMHPSN